jgi:hypothetical protein
MGMGGEYSMGDSPPEPEFVNLSRSPGIDSQPGGIDSLESIHGLLKRLQIRAQEKVKYFCAGSVL